MINPGRPRTPRSSPSSATNLTRSAAIASAIMGTRSVQSRPGLIAAARGASPGQDAPRRHRASLHRGINSSLSRLYSWVRSRSTKAAMSELGLGCVKTPTLAAGVETTFHDCMSFYTARVIHVIPAIPACPVHPKSGHSAKARVYEYAPYGAAENKSLEIKTLRPRRVPRC